jgi:hypothetical protein
MEAGRLDRVMQLGGIVSNDPVSPQSLSLREIAQSVSAIAVAAAAAFFSIGLVIVNLWLARHGVFSVEFARTEYVLAGALFVFIVVGAWVSVSWGWSNAQKGIKNWREGKKRVAIFDFFSSLLFALGTPISILTPMLQNQADFYDWLLWFSWVGIGGIAGWGKAMFYHSSEFWRNISRQSQSEPHPDKSLSHLFSVVSTMAFVLTGLAAYSYGVFPRLSPAYGGGGKEPALLFPTQAGLDVCKRLRLPIQPGPIVGPVNILTESETEIVVLPGDSKIGGFAPHAIRLRRDLFETIVPVKGNPKPLPPLEGVTAPSLTVSATS